SRGTACRARSSISQCFLYGAGLVYRHNCNAKGRPNKMNSRGASITPTPRSDPAPRMLSAKAEQFTESVIREMTRLAMKHNAVNLSQGFPDFAAPMEVKEAARQAISDDVNQSAITWGAKPLRDAIVEKFARTQHITYDPE